MWGRKQRRIDELTARVAGLKSELTSMLAQITGKNKQIIELSDVLKQANRQNTDQTQILASQSELIRGLNAQLGQLTRALEREQADARKAEEAANAAIHAGGLLGDQLRAAQAAIAVKDDIADGLASKVEQLKADKAKLSEALGQARGEVARFHAAEIAGQRKSPIVGPAPSLKDSERKYPGSPAHSGWVASVDAARPQLEVVPEVPEPDGNVGKSS